MTPLQSSVPMPDAHILQQLDTIESRRDDPVWIHRLSRDAILAAAEAASALPGPAPLRGLTFAIKDNIDLANTPTTAACPDFAYTPAASAPVVDRLIGAGAVPMGKTNLDQFATGLVGVRSPYGIPANPFNARYIPGGSSSGSAVAVAAGLCDFSLGTDTAGSGRVPAAFNNLVGLKPTRGLISTRGVVPACRSLDCISIFARTVGEAARALSVAAGFDPMDPFSRPAAPPFNAERGPPVLGVPESSQLEFFGNTEAQALFTRAVERWRAAGATIVTIDLTPFLEAARLLYEGPWVAERYAAIRTFIEQSPESLHPVTRQIIEGARKFSAIETFEASYRLASLRREAETTFSRIDALLTPTTGTVYSIEEVEAAPVELNSNLGYYTNFMNLLDLCGLALPAGFLPNGVPWGITLAAPAFHDDSLLQLGARFLGEPTPAAALEAPGPRVSFAVCGAHLRGLPLNHELTCLGARFIREARTSAHYRLYALPDTTPPKPGLLRLPSGARGAPIKVEIWSIPEPAFGHFVSRIPPPLGIGTITLEDGSRVHGFLCEAAAIDGARDITKWGGWRAFVQTTNRPGG